MLTSVLTLRWEGPPACADCAAEQVPVCGHVGFDPDSEGWTQLIGCAVHVPGLDAEHPHVLRTVDISGDRKTVTFTVDTERPAHTELIRHLSVIDTPKAHVRGVHHESGEILIEGRYDAPLQVGQRVYVAGDPHVVVGEPEYPNRDEQGIAGALPDVQVVQLMPVEEPAISPA